MQGSFDSPTMQYKISSMECIQSTVSSSHWMSTSPLVNPEPYITKVNNLSDEAITIDKGVDRAKRDAENFASNYAANFQILSELEVSTEQFSIVCLFSM